MEPNQSTTQSKKVEIIFNIPEEDLPMIYGEVPDFDYSKVDPTYREISMKNFLDISYEQVSEQEDSRWFRDSHYRFLHMPDGSFWDSEGNYFNCLGFDKSGGYYDKFGYVENPNYSTNLVAVPENEKMVENERKSFNKFVEVSSEEKIWQEDMYEGFGLQNTEGGEIKKENENKNNPQKEDEVMEDDSFVPEILSPELLEIICKGNSDSDKTTGAKNECEQSKGLQSGLNNIATIKGGNVARMEEDENMINNAQV